LDCFGIGLAKGAAVLRNDRVSARCCLSDDFEADMAH
jgi:hypothetical protein